MEKSPFAFTNLSDILIASILKKSLNDPYKNLAMVVNFVRRLTANKKSLGYFDSMLDYLKRNKDTIQRIYDSTDPLVLARFLKIYITRMHISGPNRRQKIQKKQGLRIPDIFIGEITPVCNLNCVGCYSDPTHTKEKSVFRDWDNVIKEGKKIGIFNVFWSGGEPLVERKLLLELARKYPDIWFSVFTNGTLIDDDFAEQALLARNLVFLVSVNGDENENDKIRGNGTYERTFRGVTRLREKRVPFGISVTVGKDNLESATGDSFVQACCDVGATFFMYFPYLPNTADERKFGLSPSEREALYDRVLKIRSKYQISAFYSHLNFMGSCAGGGRLVYINAYGDLQPCPFTPFTTHNVKDGLLNALLTPLNTAYSVKEMGHKDPLSMCYRLDNPSELAEILTSTGAKPVGKTDSLYFLSPPIETVQDSLDWKEISERVREGMDGRMLVKKLEKIMDEEKDSETI